MFEHRVHDRWEGGDAYDNFMGRWSQWVAQSFVRWLDMTPHAHWLDVGCGTGALTGAICELTSPREVVACDQAPSFVQHARARVSYPGVLMTVASATQLPARPGAFDAVVSGLVLNFLSDLNRALAEMRRCTRSGAIIAAYVWDYADGMEFLRRFWDAAKALDPPAAALDEGVRFPICHPEKLRAAFQGAGFQDINTHAIVVPTPFESFDDYWRPFIGGPGPAPSYVASLDPAKTESLRRRLQQSLPADKNGCIHLTARAWAVRGLVP